ncbi:hypothetical protein BDV98DRAFT_601586 [Pterulicium gracile]|uniref:BTB domain-containing protein n=1 Tax=Pterulicium gracile TaxID=1884261 RepID=A0A5C3QT68_9AGAR|nr:hypothetical protein BDV98DRAFT_601586 [Pterula gracilis]
MSSPSSHADFSISSAPSTPGQEPPITLADTPFDDADGDADTILHSSDNVEFMVHKIMLSYSSPVFRSWYEEFEPSEEFNQRYDAFTMEEDSATLTLLLRFIYPGSDPSIPCLSTFQHIMHLMREYDLIQQTTLRKFLSTPEVIQTELLRVFAISFRFGFVEEAKLAAKQCLHTRFEPCPEIEELRYLTALDFHRLWAYHRQCGVEAASLTHSLGWVPVQPRIWMESTTPATDLDSDRHGVNCQLHPLTWNVENGARCLLRGWFVDFLKDAGDVIRERPLGAAAEVLSSPEFLDPTLKKTMDCNACRPKAHLQLTSFIAHFFVKEIEEVVGAVNPVLSIEDDD